MARILMVDDNAPFLKPMCALLTAKGHDVLTTSSCEEARDLLQHDNFEVLITDIAMEPLSGMDLLHVARAKDPNRPVIMLTAYASLETALEAVKLGAFDLLTKPFRVDELIETIQRGLQWSAAVRAGVDAGTAPGGPGTNAESSRAKFLKKYIQSQVPTFPKGAR
jgi:DNA-binding NtrC family response regulator